MRNLVLIIFMIFGCSITCTSQEKDRDIRPISTFLGAKQTGDRTCHKIQHQIWEYYEDASRRLLAVGYSYLNCEENEIVDKSNNHERATDNCNIGVVDFVYFDDNSEYDIENKNCFIQLVRDYPNVKKGFFTSRIEMAAKL